jgi:cytoskeletal protein CcmA (bactofilin family)
MSVSTASSIEAKRGGRSFLASDLSVRGSIRSSGTVEIDGVVDGDISGSVIHAAGNSRIRATIDADSAFIAGAVSGLIKARSVTFANDCLFTGEVQYERLRMEPNARVEGALHPVIGSDARTFVDAAVLTEPAPRPTFRDEPATTSSRGRKFLSLLIFFMTLAAAVAAGIVYVAPAAQQWRSDLMESLKAAPPAEPVQTAPPDKVPAPASEPEPAIEGQAPKAQDEIPSAVAPVETAPDVLAEPSSQPDAAAPAETAAPPNAEELSKPSINGIEDGPAPVKLEPVSANEPAAETPAAVPVEQNAPQPPKAKAAEPAEPAASTTPPPPVKTKPKAENGSTTTKDAAVSTSGSAAGSASTDAAADPAPKDATSTSAEPAKAAPGIPAASGPASADAAKPPVEAGPDGTEESEKAPVDAAPASSAPSGVSDDGCQWVPQCASDGSGTKCVSVRQCSNRN